MSEAKRKEKKMKKIHEYYEVKEGKISRKMRKCPRCGSFMAFHKQQTVRWTCGACSYTEYVTPEEGKK